MEGWTEFSAKIRGEGVGLILFVTPKVGGAIPWVVSGLYSDNNYGKFRKIHHFLGFRYFGVRRFSKNYTRRNVAFGDQTSKEGIKSLFHL